MDFEFPLKLSPALEKKWSAYLGGVWLQDRDVTPGLGPLALIFHSRFYMSIVARGRTTAGEVVTYHRFETYYLEGDKLYSQTISDDPDRHKLQMANWKFEEGRLWINEKDEWMSFAPAVYKDLIDAGLEKRVVDKVYMMAHFSKEYPFQEKVEHLPLQSDVANRNDG